MASDDSIADTEIGRDVANRGSTVDSGDERSPRLRLASAVMFVHSLDRSDVFYRELLALKVTVQENTAALLVSPDGFQLYLRSLGAGAQHPLGGIGVQYLIWTADGEDDLRRCERCCGHTLRGSAARRSMSSPLSRDAAPTMFPW